MIDVEVFRVTGNAVKLQVKEDSTVRDVLSAIETGRTIGQDGMSLIEAAQKYYGSVEALGTLRVNGSPAGLDSAVPAGATILIVPKIEGGN
jgi:hypothetical protein